MLIILIQSDLAYGVVVAWVIILGVALASGAVMALIPAWRHRGWAIIAGTLIAAVLEFALSAFLALIWLNEHPGWDLS